MVDLYCTPLTDLIDRMRLEFLNQQAIFDLPARKWYLPGEQDMGVTFHGMRAANPVGPASGPQTQMAQNLVLAWLAGSRILELKTVQINDRLEIGRPCIDATNVGYNILGMIIDRETATPWQRHLRELIFDPLGMERTTAYASLGRHEHAVEDLTRLVESRRLARDPVRLAQLYLTRSKSYRALGDDTRADADRSTARRLEARQKP